MTKYSNEYTGFCSGCGWSQDGSHHDLIGRPGFHARCEECGRTKGVVYEAPVVTDEEPTTFVIKFGEDQHD